MKRIILLNAMIFNILLTNAQWAVSPSNSANIYNTNTGLVGIGTSTPTYVLTVSYPTGGGLGLFTTPAATNSCVSVQNANGHINLGVGNATPQPYIWSSTGNIFFGNDGQVPTLYINGMLNGNVGINTTNTAGYKFAVNGNAIFTQVVVQPYANWPDYIFNKGYPLRPLSDVAAYIRQNHHLPDVPSAADVEKHGQDLGETQAALLKKVEELTLYLIEMKKDKETEMAQIRKVLDQQDKELKKLRALLNSGRSGQ